MTRPNPTPNIIPFWKGALMSLFMLVLIFGPIIGWQKYKHDQRQIEAQHAKIEKSKAKEQMAIDKKRGWALKPPSSRTIDIDIVGPPTVPDLPPVEYYQGRITGASLNERLRVLVQNHPAREIREDLNAIIESNQVGLSFQNLAPNMLAMFMVVQTDQVEYSVHGATDNMPVFVFNPQALADDMSTQDIHAFMLVIYHEYQHYKQYIAMLESGKDTKTFRYMGLRKDQGTREDGRLWLSVEAEAYERECELALSWGVPISDMMDKLCAYAFTPEYGQFMFHILLENQGGYRSSSPASVVGMAEAAGHPDPSVYYN